MKIDTSKKMTKSNDELSTLARCETYSQAEAIVDHLAFKKFPVDRLSIVADNLKFIEDFTGSMSSGRALLRGMSKGIFLGLFFGFTFGLFDLVRPIVSAFAIAVWGILIGAILGSIIELFWFWISGGRRDFQTVSSVQAGEYKVCVSRCSCGHAIQILEDSPYVPFLEQSYYPKGSPVVGVG